jgi:leucine dehydrogenase
MIMTEISRPDLPDWGGHEKVIHIRDHDSGLDAIIAVHNTRLGPGLGGCRFHRYADFDAALTDALRLSRGMTYKNAMAGLALGGGKSVIIGDGRAMRGEARKKIMLAMGQAVQSLGGKYVAAEDMHTNETDMGIMYGVTPYVCGLPADLRKGVGGNPSPLTARGVLRSIEVAMQVPPPGRLDGLKVAVQGAGSVGYALCQLLHDAGAKLWVSDVHPDATARCRNDFGAAVMPVDDIYAAPVDVFAPCAMGAILNDQTIPVLKAKMIIGAANNQLAEERHADALAARGILYAPDYIVNAGGVIFVGCEYLGATDEAAVVAQVDRIGDTLREVLDFAAAENITTAAAADELARRRFSAA